MNSRWSEQRVEAAVRASVAETRLHPAFASMVRQFALDDSDGWRLCCGMDCSPCVNELVPAVERVREILNGEGIEPSRAGHGGDAS
jgi:hypothetical protein